MSWYNSVKDSIADFLDANKNVFDDMKKNIDEGRAKADEVYTKGVDLEADGKTFEGNAFKLGATAMATANALTAGATTKIENKINHDFPYVRKGWENIGELAEDGLSDMRQDPDKNGVSTVVAGASKTAAATMAAAMNAATLGATAAFGTELGEDVFSTQQKRIADDEAKRVRENDERHMRLGETAYPKAKDAKTTVAPPNEIEHAKVAERNERMLASSEAKAADEQAKSVAPNEVASAIKRAKIKPITADAIKNALSDSANKNRTVSARGSEFDYIQRSADGASVELGGE